MSIYAKIGHLLDAYQRCVEKNNEKWRIIHKESIEKLLSDYNLSGWIRFNYDESKPEKLVFDTSFPLNDTNGHYHGYGDHKVKITPSFVFGFIVKITGRDYNGIKDWIDSCFRSSDYDYQDKKDKEERMNRKENLSRV